MQSVHDRENTPDSGTAGTVTETEPNRDIENPEFQREVSQYKFRDAARRQAKSELDAEESAELFGETVARTPVLWRGDQLDDAENEPDDLIDGLWPAGGNVLLSAQAKAGKTTLIHNVIRSLVDGVPLFGRYDVAEGERKVLLVDTEMGQAKSQAWIAHQRLAGAHRLAGWSLKGCAGMLDVRSEHVRGVWTESIAKWRPDVVVLDCLTPVFLTLGLNENYADEGGAWLARFWSLMGEIGVSATFTSHHNRKHGQDPRGSSTFTGLPDALWSLKLDNSEDLASPREFQAFGRDVSEKTPLDYDHERRRLTTGSHRMSPTQRRGERYAHDLRNRIVSYVKANPQMSARAIREGIHANYEATRREIRNLVDTHGEISELNGPRGPVYEATETPPQPDSADTHSNGRPPGAAAINDILGSSPEGGRNRVPFSG